MAAPGAGAPTGTVSFYDGGTLLGTVSIQSDGTATLGLQSISSGPHALTVVYNGDSNFASSQKVDQIAIPWRLDLGLIFNNAPAR